MKRNLFIAIVLMAVLVSCSWWDKDKHKNMHELDIDLNFTFNTTRMVTVEITGPIETDFNLFLEYEGDTKSPKDTLLLDKMVVATMTDSTGVFEDIITLPSYGNYVYLQSGEYIKKLTIDKTTTTEGEVIDSFEIPKYLANNSGSKCHTIYIYYPCKDTYGTVMFEDLWPNTGDYDLNDLVIDANWIEKYYSDEWIWVPPAWSWFRQIFEIEAKFKIRATGAGYKISFAVQLPNLCYIDGTVTTTLSQGLEVEQDNNTIIFIFDVHEALGSPAGTWTNTDESMAYYPPVEFTVHIPIQYVNGLDPAWAAWISDQNNPIYNPPYNPFIYVNDDRSHEIHLANCPPTDSMNTALFDTGDDASNPAAGIYFRTSNGLPWAVNVGESTVYLKETIPIIDGFNHFAQWAESGGTTYTDWYKDKSGYINWENIYTEP